MIQKTEVVHVRLNSENINQLRELSNLLSIKRQSKLEWTDCLREAVSLYLESNIDFINEFNDKITSYNGGV